MSLFKKPKTAFVFSGGGSRGSYQIGVWKALREIGIKPNMIMGTSVGAINATMVVLNDLESAEKLWTELETEEIFDISTDNKFLEKGDGDLFGISMEEAYGYAKEILTNGGAGSNGMYNILKKYVDEKKFRKSKVEYGMVTASLPNFEAHKLYTEDIPVGQLHKYILASASCFPAAQTCQIGDIKYVDGGYADNLPVGMALSKGAERIIAIDLQAVGKINEDELKFAEKNVDFKLIRASFDLGNFLSFNPDVAKNNLRYGYLDGLRAFDKIDGEVYSFKKGYFEAEMLPFADAAASIFDVDGREIYTPKTLDQELKFKVLDAQVNLHRHPLKINGPIGIPNWDLIKSKLSGLNKKVDSKTLVAFIAEELRDKGDKSKFNVRAVRDVLNKEILAARYIVMKGLLEE